MKRASGVLMHVSSLWGEYSEGSFGTAAKQWIDFLSDCGFSYWQTLPFCLPDDCNSPYKSFSAFSVNPFFIDLDILKSKGLITDGEENDARQKTPYSCEFTRLKEQRLSLLRRAAERFDEWDKAEEFFARHAETLLFCRFMALKTANGMLPWNEWKTDVLDASALKTWKFICYEFFAQWKQIADYAHSKNIKIIGDIPIYVAYDSSDVWAHPDMFMLDENRRMTDVAGVPPDYFSADGQLWGNPLYDWKAMKDDDFAWWRARIAFMTELFDGVRIDHFRGIESFYAVPAAAKTAKEGRWESGPGEALINAIKQAAGGKLLIAEDLGDITPEVRALVDKSGFPGMRVLQFAFLGDASSPHLPHNYDNNCIAYTGTHDNNTLLGYIWELDEKTRGRVLEYFGYGGDWDACYDCIVRAMTSSHAGIVIFPVQDLLHYGSDTRLNTPGTAEGNWAYRITKEQLEKIDRKTLRRWNEIYGRI